MVTRYVRLGAVAALLVGCGADQPAPTQIEQVEVPLLSRDGDKDNNGADNNGVDRHIGARLLGANEVFTPATPGGPTPADSRAHGRAVFRISKDGSSVDFVLIASRIDNAFMAHIHCGAPTVNGPIRMWLYPTIGPTGAPGPLGSGPHDGLLASGTFSPTGIVCPATATSPAMPLLDAIRAGLAYVNVHTNDGVAPTNTGPGDFPGGEIRAQLTSHKGHGDHGGH
jgi:hypothetical protein